MNEKEKQELKRFWRFSYKTILAVILIIILFLPLLFMWSINNKSFDKTFKIYDEIMEFAE